MNSDPQTSFTCATCGKVHDGMPTDSGFTLPEDVWAIPEVDRASRAKWTSDLCQLGGRFFIRCLVRLPFLEREGFYGWGVWAEVDWPTFQRYLELYEVDASNEPAASGTLANDIPTYESTIGLPIQIHFGTSTERPTISFANDEQHALAREARAGLTASRHHEFLAARDVPAAANP